MISQTLQTSLVARTSALTQRRPHIWTRPVVATALRHLRRVSPAKPKTDLYEQVRKKNLLPYIAQMGLYERSASSIPTAPISNKTTFNYFYWQRGFVIYGNCLHAGMLSATSTPLSLLYLKVVNDFDVIDISGNSGVVGILGSALIAWIVIAHLVGK